MEGVSKQSDSYVRLQKLDKLIVLYDSNDINLDGRDSFTESVRDKVQCAYGWHLPWLKMERAWKLSMLLSENSQS